MRILITGGKGMLGRTLQKELAEHELIVADLPDCDITDTAGFDRFLAAAKADAVIHCAAMTAVDKCETEIDLAYRLNALFRQCRGGMLPAQRAADRNFD